MQTHDDQEAKSYMWQGAVWRSEILGGDPEDDHAVSETGDRAALSALLRAIWTGEATAIPTAPKTPAPSTPAPRSGTATTTTAIGAGDLDETGKARALAKIQTARELGITLPASKADGLLYDVGTAVMASAWASERKAFDRLPAGETVLPRVRDAIRAEERETFSFPAWELRMSLNSGRLGHKPAGATEVTPGKVWEPTRRCLQGFYQRSGIGTVPDHWPNDVKGNAVNSLCVRYAKDRPGQLLVDGQDPMVAIRVQKATGRAFACVSPSYTAFDGDLVIEALLQALPRGSRVGIDYDPHNARGRVEIVTLQEEQPVVGEPFKTSFTVSWDDTGGGAIKGDGGLFSARCLNLTRIWTSVGSFSIRHAGSVRRLAARFRQDFDRVARVVSQFSKAYGHAASEELTNTERLEGTAFLQGIYRSLLERDLVPVVGRREDAVKELAIQALADENHAGLTRAGIANGITRYAHRVNQDPWKRDDLEKVAGQILWSGDRRPVKLDYLAAAV